MTPRQTNAPGAPASATEANLRIRNNRNNHWYCSPIDLVLSRLERVQDTGPRTWRASCPTGAHPRGDRSRGLSVRAGDNDVVLLRCFAGCSAADIVQAVGLELADLFPPRPTLSAPARPKAPLIPWRDLLGALGVDLMACSLAFSDLAAGKRFSAEDAVYIARRAADLADIVREVRHGG